MIIPMLVCKDAAQEIEFCKNAFEAKELSRREQETGDVIHALLTVREALLMIHDESPHLGSKAPRPDGTSSVVNYLYCDDVDTVIARAVSFGAKILMHPEDQVWGDRVGRIIDPANHVWNVATRPNSDENES